MEQSVEVKKPVLVDCPLSNHGLNGKILLSKLNPHVESLDEDHLYHIGLSNRQHDLQRLFSDVKFVCFGGTPSRMEIFAKFMANEFDLDLDEVKNFAETTDRYAVFKAGPVLSVSDDSNGEELNKYSEQFVVSTDSDTDWARDRRRSGKGRPEKHGIGIPSLSIVFQEIVKLLHYSGCDDVTFFRIGTSGGIGLEGGTVIVSNKVVNGALQPEYPAIVLGKKVARAAPVDQSLAEELCACAREEDEFKTVLGTTLCADDFYEGQGRLDGAFCNHDDEDKLAWLRTVREHGVVNMEMESLGFIALCHRAGVRGAVCCVSLLNRLHGDGITTNKQLLLDWQTYPQLLVARFIKQTIQRCQK